MSSRTKLICYILNNKLSTADVKYSRGVNINLDFTVNKLAGNNGISFSMSLFLLSLVLTEQ